MKTEIEAKFLNVDPGKFRAKMKSLNAGLVNPERLMKRKNFDFEDSRLQRVNGWVRVRDEGDKITLSYKQLNDRTIQGTKEASVTVGSFDDTCGFLESIGMEVKSYHVTKRESWTLDGVEVEIDTWPWIPTYVELEGRSEKSIKETAAKLGLDWNQALHGSVEIAYQSYFDLTEEEIDSWDEITFIQTPDWLEEKRIKR
ncbi:MAG TPA: CYTH domain-containing protein [Candidatus Saccharimonadales bacterium]|nr:CYTH domain-containing protein [Candidatus Saccharimonadales bacterium]